jgi:hypothetical protein
MPVENENLKRFACVVGGGALGAFLLRSHYDEAKKSRAEKDDPEGVEWICELVGELLEDWTPRDYDREDEYTRALLRYLRRSISAELDDDDPEVEIELWPDTSEGRPDLLIDDSLALELKINPNKAERDRCVGQCAAYSREWVTRIILIDTPTHVVRDVEDLLAVKGLDHIKVIQFI